jgi:hypothetical protein
MQNDVAIFLDLDNVVIGATEVGLAFDINLVLEHVRTMTGGRLVLRRAYGDWRQRSNLTKELASAGFELQSTVRLSSNSKNLADMQLVVDTMSTLVDGQDFGTYVLITGDRDFAPVVQALRKRGKQVIGLGVRHASSQSLVRLCDQYVYYDDLAATSQELQNDEVEDLMQRALSQLLQDQAQVPASLLKQRMQALSKGSFSRSPQGRRSFRKLLAEYPQLVAVEQEGTTLYIRRPDSGSGAQPPVIEGRHLDEQEVRGLIQQALRELLADRPMVRASLLKQRMQELSQGAFDETQHGDKTFRRFLERYPDLVCTMQEGSTLYVCDATTAQAGEVYGRPQLLGEQETLDLLEQALDELLVDQARVRASLLKQHMQELSRGAFSESLQGFDSFRAFLEQYPRYVQLQQRGTTLMIFRPEEQAEVEEPYLAYRTILKKRGLRVVPAEIRLTILGDLVTALSRQDGLPWRTVVNGLDGYYRQRDVDISKSLINDTLRIARRASVITVANGASLGETPVHLNLQGERQFQDAVMRCDAAYLSEIIAAGEDLDLEQAALALYDAADRARYLKVIYRRFAPNGRPGR